MTLLMHLEDKIVGCDDAKKKLVGRVDTWRNDKSAYPVILLVGPRESGRKIISEETAKSLKLPWIEIDNSNYAMFVRGEEVKVLLYF